MSSWFEGMTISEAANMPYLGASTYWTLTGRYNDGKYPSAEVVARSQLGYVRRVLDRTPKWRWIKRRHLRRAVGHGERILRAIQGPPKPPPPGPPDPPDISKRRVWR